MDESARVMSAVGRLEKFLYSRAPVCSRCESMWATELSRRRTSCSLLISSEKMPTVLPSRTAACSAMLSARLVLPIEGRAPRARGEAGLEALLADREQLLLGAVHGRRDVRGLLVADAGDAPRGGDEVAQHRLALDDPSVVGGGPRRRRGGGEAGG